MNSDVLRIGLGKVGESHVLKLSGELDEHTSHLLKAAAQSYLNDAEQVIVNLDELDYIDSHGLSTLVRMWVDASDQQSRLLIACDNPRIHRILEITGLLNLFTLAPSEEATLNAAA